MSIRTIVTEPALEPITLAETKTHLRVEHADHDSYIPNLIKAARVQTENVLSRALITQTWDYWLDAFVWEMDLPLAPLQSVTTVKYTDTDGTQQTLSSAVYEVDTDSVPGRIYLGYQQTWPSTRGTPKDIEIRFVAGYGDAETDIPESIRQAMLLLVGHYYNNAEATSVVPLHETPMAYQALIAPYRIIKI